MGEIYQNKVQSTLNSSKTNDKNRLTSCDSLEKELIIRIKEGDAEAKKLLVEDNLYLVNLIAKKYFGLGLPFEDLVQEGTIGLLMAIDKFDYNKGYKFSTYAAYWIKKYIICSLYNINVVGLSYHICEDIIKVNKVIAELNLRGFEPTAEVIADYLSMPIQDVEKLLFLRQPCLSLNYTFDNGKGEQEIELRSSEESLEEKVIEKNFPLELINLLKDSVPNERNFRILMLRFGANNEAKLTALECAEIFAISRQRVDQIVDETLDKIRRSSNIQKIADYTDNPEQSMLRLRKK